MIYPASHVLEAWATQLRATSLVLRFVQGDASKISNSALNRYSGMSRERMVQMMKQPEILLLHDGAQRDQGGRVDHICSAVLCPFQMPSSATIDTDYPPAMDFAHAVFGGSTVDGGDPNHMTGLNEGIEAAVLLSYTFQPIQNDVDRWVIQVSIKEHCARA